MTGPNPYKARTTESLVELARSIVTGPRTWSATDRLSVLSAIADRLESLDDLIAPLQADQCWRCKATHDDEPHEVRIELYAAMRDGGDQGARQWVRDRYGAMHDSDLHAAHPSWVANDDKAADQ